MAWFKVDDKLWGNEKWVAASKGARALWTSAGAWAAFQVTDGHIPAHILPILRATRGEAVELARIKLWHAFGHDCDRCEQPRDPKGWIFHDWPEYQPDAASEIVRRDAGHKAMSEKGREGNHLRWHEGRGIVVPTCPYCVPDVIPDDEPESGPTRVLSPRPVPTRTRSLVGSVRGVMAESVSNRRSADARVGDELDLAIHEGEAR